jgi:hypothetical protein
MPPFQQGGARYLISLAYNYTTDFSVVFLFSPNSFGLPGFSGQPVLL